MFDITSTFLELGDSTSHNLEYANRSHVNLNYGEETITESNLLEIRRRHHKIVEILAFTKPEERNFGADWEWRIIGRIYKYEMRVQAKLTNSGDEVNFTYKPKSSNKLQRDILIEQAKRDDMQPVYCIYSTERQRRKWREDRSLYGYKSFQAGCLLANAHDVPRTVTKLEDIEEKCIPWHYLFSPAIWMYSEIFEDPKEYFCSGRFHLPVMVYPDSDRNNSILFDDSSWNPPTIKDLNEDTGRKFDWTGVKETTEDDFKFIRYPEEYGVSYCKEKGVSRVLLLNVSGRI